MSSKQDTGADQEEKSGDAAPDAEDRATAMWAPMAQKLFEGEQDRREAVGGSEGSVQGTIESPGADPEEAATEMMVGEPEGMDAHDTVKVTPEEAAASIAAAEREAAELLGNSVEVTGVEGRIARQLAITERARRDTSNTEVINRNKVHRPNRQCRMCGKKVTSPRPRRVRGSTLGDGGYRCEKCENVFCVVHVVRVSNIIESLISGARFRCQLCLPEK